VLWEPLSGPPVALTGFLAAAEGFFVGREPQLERLEGLWKEAGGGQPRAALLAGEPGVGKTRLAAQLAGRLHAQGALVLAGRCDEDLGVPYQPFVEALRHFVAGSRPEELPVALGRHAEELVRLVPELAERLPALGPPLRSDPETERYRLFDAVAAWLADAGGGSSALLVLDDLQWAAKPTLLLLHHLVRFPEPLPLLVVATYRDTEIGPGHALTQLLADLRRVERVERFPLTGLDETEVAAFVAEAVGRPLSPADETLPRAVWAETEGNPFFVAEVLRHLAESGLLASLEEKDRRLTNLALEKVGVPEGVREVVGRRLSRLSDDANRALSYASIIGVEFEAALVQAAGGFTEDVVLAALDEAVASRLVVEVPGAPDRCAFAHALVRATLEDRVTSVRRAALHRRVAEAIETVHARRLDDCLPALAHHFARAGGGVSSKAVEYATRAGDRAMDQLAFEAAAAHYEQALAALDATGEDERRRRGGVLVALGTARARGGDARAGDAFRSAGELARRVGDAEILAGAALGLADLWGLTGAVDEDRMSLLEEAREALGGGVSPLTAQVLGRLATELYFVPGSWDRRDRLSGEAVAVARRLDDPRTLALSLHARNYAVWAPGGATQRLTIGREIVDLARQCGDRELALHGHTWCQTALLELGDIATLDADLTAYEHVADELRQPRYRWYAATRRAMRILLAGDLDEGERLARTARTLGRDAGEPDAENVFGGQMFIVWQERPTREAIDHSDARCRTAEATAGADSFLTLALRLMWLLLAADTPATTEEAQADLARRLPSAVEHLDPTFYGMGWSIFAVLLTSAAVRMSALDVAGRLYDVLAPYAALVAQDCGAVAFHGAYAHHLGTLAATLERWDEADDHLAQAVAMHDRMGARAYLARSRVEWARMLLARRAPGDAARARDLLGQVRAAARDLGLSTTDRQAVVLEGR
jgi:AAA ATPase-like protein